MMIRRIAALCAATGALTLLAGPTALAATTVGETGPGTACGGGTVFFQGATNGGASYTVPTGGGVITSWSTQAGAGAGQSAALKLLRPINATDYTVTGTSSVVPLLESAANTFEVRIPVTGEETLGYWFPPSAIQDCLINTGNFGDVLRYKSGQYPEPGVGDTQTGTVDVHGYRVNIRAEVEPDADGDGYGDESQDLCPTSAATHDACPVAAANGTATKPADASTIPTVSKRDTTAPVITKPSLSASVFAVNTRAGASAAKGSRLFLTLSEAATVVFVTEQRVGNRWRKVRIFGKRFPAGTNRLDYSGKIKPRGKQRALKPGRYRLRMRPSDRAGNRGKVTTVGFEIAK